jgi:AcrR family transcriptional regulator
VLTRNRDEEGDGVTVEAATPARRARRTGDRRAAILAAAATCFAERGYQRATTKEIARLAGVAEGTIYRHFPSKQALFFTFLEGMVLAPLMTILQSGQGLDDAQIVRAFLADRLQRFADQRDLIKSFLAEAFFDPQVAAELAERIIKPGTLVGELYVQQRIAEGAFRAMDPALAVRGLLGLVFVHFFFWALMPEEIDRYPREALVDELTQLFLHGVVRPAGQAGMPVRLEEVAS